MSNSSLLVELFVEELPPKALRKLGAAFATALAGSLKTQGLAAHDVQVTPYASPRRLGAHLSAVAPKAADKPLTQKLMPVTVGLDAGGAPTPALVKRLASLGAGPEAATRLIRRMDGKAEALFMQSVVPGATLAEGLQRALAEALAALPIPKVMTYQLADGWTSVQFVRPAHGLVALHGADVVPVSALGLDAGRVTHGHRFEAARDPIVISDADSYAGQLEKEGAVIAGFAARRDEIARQMEAAAAASGLTPIQDDALLDEVTALVERPNVLSAQFEKAYLEVPQECLILTMKANQKYFPLLDAAGKLTNKFLIVSNIRTGDTSAVVRGNERVVRPRLADARFFFDQDRKATLDSRVAGLAKVVYHNKLGTQGERTERVRAIARAIGAQLGGDTLAAKADQAARLAKADLITDMVGEFPELQGVMGRYYAMHDGVDADVADAIEDHYKPRFSGDELPRNRVGLVVALADKLETLVGLFGVGQLPTGDKDPFALRRHALGAVRILIEADLALDLRQLLEACVAGFTQLTSNPVEELMTFVYDRIRHYYSISSLDEEVIDSRKRHFSADASERLKFSAPQIEAVLSLSPAIIGNIPKHLKAVNAFADLPESGPLAAANKRVNNILRKAEGKGAANIDNALLKEPEEIALHDSLSRVRLQADSAFDQGDYTRSLQTLAALKTPVDNFFDKVMVNAEDPALRANRLGLLAMLHAAMNRVADLSKLAT